MMFDFIEKGFMEMGKLCLSEPQRKHITTVYIKRDYVSYYGELIRSEVWYEYKPEEDMMAGDNSRASGFTFYYIEKHAIKDRLKTVNKLPYEERIR